jgi:predicted NAD/FAD-binding protein
LEDFLQARTFPPDMVEGFLLPALATVATCSYASARAFPAEVVIGYLGAGVTRECVRRAREGADDVAGRLLQGVADLRCGVKVLDVRRAGAGATVQVEGEMLHRFDHVVVASQANQALSLLGDASDVERRVLGAFRYEPVEVLMHRDTAFMPARRRDWSAVNLRVHAGQQGPESTIWVNAVQPALRTVADVFQTVQPQREVDPSLAIARARFERPVVQADSTAALSGLGDLHAEPGRRVWFCGSYAQPGIPLLESAVRSAEVVVRALCRATSPTT